MKPFWVWGDDLFVVREEYGVEIVAESAQEAAARYGRQEHATASGDTPYSCSVRDPEGVVTEWLIKEVRTITAEPQRL